MNKDTLIETMTEIKELIKNKYENTIKEIDEAIEKMKKDDLTHQQLFYFQGLATGLKEKLASTKPSKTFEF
jgi:hypothetical protein